jgi:hypothetical protein
MQKSYRQGWISALMCEMPSFKKIGPIAFMFYGQKGKLTPASITVRRTEAPGAGAEEVPECA